MPTVQRPKKSKAKKKSKAPTIQINVDAKEAPERIYSNHVQVRLTQWDATLEFCEVGPLSEEETKTSGTIEVTVSPKTRVVLSHQVFVGLATAMNDLLKKNFEKMKVTKDDS